MKGFLLWAIGLYRRYVSPARTPCCRFIPTCSAYAMEAIQVHGALRGGYLALRRLLKCHPFHKQNSIQYDPVPPPKRS